MALMLGFLGVPAKESENKPCHANSRPCRLTKHLYRNLRKTSLSLIMAIPITMNMSVVNL